MLFRSTMTSSDGGVSNYTFVQEGEAHRNGWCKMRLVIIEHVEHANDTVKRSSHITRYDPAVHRHDGHYMSHLWSARRVYLPGYRDYQYCLINAFGSKNELKLDRVQQ